MSVAAHSSVQSPARRARLGFVGVGWIGRNRMEAMLATGVAAATAIVEPSAEQAAAACAGAPDAAVFPDLDTALAAGLDGVVIATPSALHADQAVQALERGVAVFCQKPLGRTRREVGRVIDAARANDRLLGVDMSYRWTAVAQEMVKAVRSGAIGAPFAIDLTFHNAYGPDKPWFHDRALSGGGCVIDLGVHLVDLALWCLDFPRVRRVESALFRQGERVSAEDAVEDCAIAFIELETGGVIRLACSWNLHAGRDAVIEATLHGPKGGLSMANVDGSFYDFAAERFDGTRTTALVAPPDDWGGRAAADWARRLAAGARFDPAIAELEAVADVIDRIYAR